ncbi:MULTISPECIES: winged helix-turn-helix domain-containing protein [Catenuloplanes]|uniref:GntR family trehalose operon transcriptional repressor/GntR family transcriptional regulator n=1 Tax=Catenuloplanes niger TaxID=587534 RepID=A0AAE3ZHY9_9ACTN|nr:winged helix-turn-helix domain-containing protein [Catenuloplanes niger]MDR7320238.1 GntR family trehalose operon transcriptional repressor/GntR family transcriptional regulator [Catenuloplanes niger]
MPATPIYQQIMADIRTKISNGDLKPGDKLPSIAELTVAYKCSAEPVKMAIRMLNTLGELQGHQGRGVYVAADSTTQSRPQAI